MDHEQDPPPPYTRHPDQEGFGSSSIPEAPSTETLPVESKPPLPPRPGRTPPHTSFPNPSSSTPQKFPLSWTLHRSNGAYFIAETNNNNNNNQEAPRPLFAVSQGSKSAPNQPADLVLHDGPDVDGDSAAPPLATGERHKTFTGGTHSVITLPGAGSGISPEEPLRTSISWPHISYAFDVDVGAGGPDDLGRLRRETFEWRHSSGSAVSALGAGTTGWKLLRLSKEPPPGSGNSFAFAGPGGGEMSSDEKEIFLSDLIIPLVVILVPGLVHCSTTTENNTGEMDWYSDPNAGKTKDWSQQSVAELKRKLITANHILHHHGAVDAYGHISARHPTDRGVYIMSGYLAPALVTTAADLIEYRVADSGAVDPGAGKGYAERFIHGEVFRMYPDVNCVVHSHAETILPYVAATEVPLMPVFHMAGFLGSKTPVFDIAKIYQPGESQDMLVRDARLGTALASTFSNSPADGVSPPSMDHTVVLMRRHGFTTYGSDIETGVYRAVYTKINAAAQTNTAIVQGAFGSQGEAGFEPMSEAMIEGCKKMQAGTSDKAWRLWVAEVENAGLYVNRG